MRAVARAQPNIALVKYWGKRNLKQNLPAVGSISITLDQLYTEMAVSLEPALEQDELTINGSSSASMLPRISRCLDRVLAPDRPAARIESTCNFPIAAGLASSASAFAAAVVAAAATAEQPRQRSALASLAAAASGSAARSLYDGFVELENAADAIQVRSLKSPDDWPLSVVVAITTEDSKPVGSTEAMEQSRKTSPFYGHWVDTQQADLEAARSAIEQNDFAALAAVAEHNCLKMHSVMWASRPAIVYWNSATLNCLQTVRSMQADGVDVFFTIDAGPQLKAVCTPENADRVRAELDATAGVQATMLCGLGLGAAVVSNE